MTDNGFPTPDELAASRRSGSLTAIRQTADLSLRELAKKAGIRPSLLSGVETGMIPADPDTVDQLATALGLPYGRVFLACSACRQAYLNRPPEGPTVTISCGPQGHSKITRTA